MSDKEVSDVQNNTEVSEIIDILNKNTELSQEILVQVKTINEVLLRQVMMGLENVVSKVDNNSERLSSKIDTFISTCTGGKSVQTKRTGVKQTKKRTGGPRIGGPRQNILGWIKEGYIREGWEFFSFVIEDTEETIKALLASKENSANKKKNGVIRKKAEAAFIWHKIKDVPGVQEETRAKYDEDKEQQLKKEAKLAEEDLSEESTE